MKTSYHPATDSLYIHLADHAPVDSVELTDGLVVDYDLHGVAVGIDMQRVSQATGLKGEEVKCSYLYCAPDCAASSRLARPAARGTLGRIQLLFLG